MGEMKPSFRVCTAGEYRSDELVLLKAQINFRGEHWAFAETGDANVIFCDLDSEAGRAAWAGLDSDESRTAKVAATGGLPPGDAHYAVERPLRTVKLIALFDQIESTFGKSSRASKTAKRSAGSTPKAEEWEVSSSESDALLLGILKSLSGRDTVAISLGGPPDIIVSPKARTSFSLDWAALSDLARSPAEAIRCESITPQEMEAVARERGLVPRQLKELIWFAALEGSQGRPLPNSGMSRRVRLGRLPDLARLHHSPTHVRIGVMMTHRAATLEEIAQRARAPLADVIDFYNACVSLNLVKAATGSAPARPARQVSAEKLGLFQRILTRLSQPGEAVG
jgi:hypothetical protein